MKTALITGASSEIGLSIAKKIENNYHLILIKHKKEINIKALKNTPTILSCDLNDEIEIRNLINNLKNTKIDLLINVAGYDQNESIDNISMENLLTTLKINLLAPFILIQKLFDKNSSGTVINIASTDGIDTFNEYNMPYATSKAALIHLTKQLDFIYKNLKIYALCPNYVNTETVKSMDPTFLKQELKRIKQNQLNSPNDVATKVEEIINTLPKEIIIRME